MGAPGDERQAVAGEVAYQRLESRHVVLYFRGVYVLGTPSRPPACPACRPLVIQAGTHEVLLDDAVRLARQAATADVAVTLDITPGVPHVFQAYYPVLDEAAAALDRAGQLLSAHLAGAELVTG
jgi:acetyl esterase/lipase